MFFAGNLLTTSILTPFSAFTIEGYTVIFTTYNLLDNSEGGLVSGTCSKRWPFSYITSKMKKKPGKLKSAIVDPAEQAIGSIRDHCLVVSQVPRIEEHPLVYS